MENLDKPRPGVGVRFRGMSVCDMCRSVGLFYEGDGGPCDSDGGLVYGLVNVEHGYVDVCEVGDAYKALGGFLDVAGNVYLGFGCVNLPTDHEKFWALAQEVQKEFEREDITIHHVISYQRFGSGIERDRELLADKDEWSEVEVIGFVLSELLREQGLCECGRRTSDCKTFDGYDAEHGDR